MKKSVLPRKTLLLTCLLATALGVKAEVKLPAIFSDGMVMQQQSNANLWGTATAGKQVVITTGWNNKQYRTKADATGKWQVAVATPKAGGPYTLTFNDGQTTSLKNVLVGEVWLCSGQSNMEMPMKGFKNNRWQEPIWMF